MLPRLLLVATAVMVAAPAAAAEGWLHWRGPAMDGTSADRYLPEYLGSGSPAPLWSVELPGRGTPVVDGRRVYTLGYRGEGADLVEVLGAYEASTGGTLWELDHPDFLSDIIYDRYSIGSPTVDPETGAIYYLTSAGLLSAVDRDGRLLWRRSLMEEIGRLTFPNGRTGAPVIDERLVILHAITAGWGDHGRASNRFYAFDKVSGQLVWVSTPGTRPVDSSFSPPLLGWTAGRRALWAGTGCGHVVCVDARSGDPLWRFPMANGGVNAGVIRHGERFFAVHGKENLDAATAGRMVAIEPGGAVAAPAAGEPVVLGREHERWRADLTSFTSSPVPVGDRLYVTVATGELVTVRRDTGEVLARQRLAADQLHASPLYGAGRLYVPMHDGSLHVLRPTRDGAEKLRSVQLAGACLGAPAAWSGRLFVHTTERLYAFGARTEAPRGRTTPDAADDDAEPAPGPAVRLRIVPPEITISPGEHAWLRLERLDAAGHVVGHAVAPAWRRAFPGGAHWTDHADVQFRLPDLVEAVPGSQPSAGWFTVRDGDFEATLRVRVVAGVGWEEGFEATVMRPEADGADAVGAAPLYWIGGRGKWDVREVDGSKVLAKTLDKLILQRSMAFFGPSEMRNYVLHADVRTDGNRRVKSDVGLINQRYIIALKGNWQQLEVSSNHERLKVAVPFEVRPGTWYRMTTRVDLLPDRSGVVRARVWPREEAEPEGWTLEVPVARPHLEGSPGVFGFSPQGRFRVYVDNLLLTMNR